MMDPTKEVINVALTAIRIHGPGWFTYPSLSLLSAAIVEPWKSAVLNAVIFMAGLVSIP